MKRIPTLLLIAVLASGAYAADAPAPVQPAASTAPAAESAKPAEVTAPPKPVAKPKPAPAQPAKAVPKPPAKPRNTGATEFEVSAYTSEIADQMNGRVNLSRIDPRKRVWLRTGYGLSKSRSFTKTKINQTELGTFNIDVGYRKGGAKSYHFIQAAASMRTRKPSLRNYPDRSGYRTISAGFGKTIFSALDCEVSLADVSRVTRTGATERMITPVYNFGLRAPFSSVALLDGDLRLVEPFADDPLVDFRLNLTYKLTSATSLRFTYLANNLLNNLLIPISSRPNSEWDKSFRISLVFNRGVR